MGVSELEQILTEYEQKKRLAEIEEKEFYLNMIDIWDSECYRLSEKYHDEKMQIIKKLKKEV